MDGRRVTLVVATLLLACACAFATPPKVACVQAFDPALHKAVPHSTWSGREITVCGVAHDSDGDATLSTYEWDFGDGSPKVSGAVVDPYVIAAQHTYIGEVWDMFVARLKVTDSSGQSATDDYLVMIEDGSDLRVQINAAIDSGLWRLHRDMTRTNLADGVPCGYWPYSPMTAGVSGACTEAFEIQGSLPTGNPDEDPYVETVRRGLNYLLSVTNSFSVSQHPTYCPLGSPDANSNGIGLGCYTDGGHSMYECGITLMTFASSLSPDEVAATGNLNVIGRRYRDIVQDMVDFLVWGQNDAYAGSYRGGWRYGPNSGNSDNSCSQWPVIGMEAAESNFGSIVPTFLRTELNGWIDFIQDDASGGSGYDVPWSWINIAKTGGLLAQMKFYGDRLAPAPPTRLTAATEYIYNNWSTDPEHFGSYYALYSVMKGFRLLGIQTIHPINSPTGFDWYGDPDRGYARWTVNDQNPDGAWYYGQWIGHPMNSAWALLTLQRSVVDPPPVAVAGPDMPKHPPCTIAVAFDGSGSFHRNPDRRIASYHWDFGDGTEATGVSTSHCFPVFNNPDGTIDWGLTTRDYTVTLRVTDDNPAGPKSDSDECVVHIGAPPWAPVAMLTAPDKAYPCASVVLDASQSYDPNGQFYPATTHPWHGWITKWEWDFDGDGIFDDASGARVTWSACQEGLAVVKVRITNNFGVTDQASRVVEVSLSANQPPDCSRAYPSIARIWPPNSRTLTSISIKGVTDPDGDPVKITITSIFQDEPTRGQCTGDLSPDGFGIGTSIAKVRAERGTKGDGRVYTIGFKAEDPKGGVCTNTVKVGVPRAIVPYLILVDGGPLYDSTKR